MNGIGCKTTATSGGDAFIVLVTEPISRGLPPPAPLPPLPLPPPPVPSVDPYKTRPRKPTRKERTAFVVLPELPPPPPADMANPNTSCSGRVSPFRAYGFKTPEAGRSRASSPRPLRRQVSDSQIVAKKKKTAAVSSLSDVTRRLSASSKDLTVLSNKSKSSAASKSKASTPKPARKVLPTARKPPVSPTRATKTPLPSRTPKTPQPQKTALPPKTPLPSKKPQPPKTAKPPLSPSGPTASKSPTKPKTTASTHGTPNCSSPAKMSNKSPRLSKKPIVNGSPAKLEYVPGDTIGGTTTTAATVAENITTEAVTGGSTTTTTATTAAAASASISVVAPVAIDPETVTRITVTPVTATPPVVVVTQSTAVTNSDPVITQTTAAAVALPSTRITSTVTPAVPPPIGDPPVRPSVLLLPQDATVATKADVNRPKLPPAIKPSAVASTPALSYQMKGIKIDAESLNQSGGRAGMSTFMATRKMSISNGHKTVAWARPSEKIIVPEPKEEPSGYRRFANRLCCAMKCCPTKCNRKTCVCHCAVASKCWAAVWKRRPRLCESSAAAAEEGTGGWWSRLCRCCCCRCKRNKASLSENSELGESTDDLPPLTFFSKLKNRLGGLCCCCAAVATCFRRCCCCTGGQAKRGDVPKKLAHRKRPPFRCTGCCTNIPKLDAVFVDHSSVMRGAIPVLPLTLAWICLVFNVILPGAGTFSSGVFCLCVGKPRFTVNDTFQSRLGSLLVNAIVAASQLFTVLFCLVGWGWSVWWGVIMIKMAKKYQKVKLMDQPAATETPASVEQNHRDLI